MATTYTTRNPVDEVAIGDVDNFKATQLAASMVSRDDMASSLSPQPSPRINLPPPPNPAFSFPARPSSSAPSSLSRGTSRRHQSAIDIPVGLGVESTDQRRRSPALPDFIFNPGTTLSPESASRRPRPPALPDFSFNPGATCTTDLSRLSPSLSPSSPRTIPNHMGHRRGGSEFVGGKLKSGESITVMGTSPTKSESGFASPTLGPTSGPHTHRRGHSHRRSAAISSHDLSLILQAGPSSSRGSSAPSSPADFSGNNPGFSNMEDQMTVEVPPTSFGETGETEENVVAEKTSQSTTPPSPKPITRNRVGFVEAVEIIPRPLSLVSTDTASTVRPGHSLSGSISSIASVTISTATERDPPVILGSPVSHSKPSSRPSTAGAVLERTSSLHIAIENTPSPRRRNSIPILNDLAQEKPSPSALSTPTKTPKRWSFFGFDSFAAAGSPTKARPVSSSSSDITRNGTDLAPFHDDEALDLGNSEYVFPVEEKKKSSKKKQKRVKSWAGSILTRKSKTRAQKSKARRRSQTPPISRFTKDQDVDQDMDNDLEIAEQSPEAQVETSRPRPASDSETMKSRPTRVEDEVPFPMIDLDAALGPFNTPSRDPQWEEAQRTGLPPKRQLHSAAGLRGFSGPGMHYHRRAESAPEMPPFEGGRFSIHRFGSSSTMADVFEEDEEEEDEHSGQSATEDSVSELQDTSTSERDEGCDAEDAASTPTQEHNTGLINFQTDALTIPSVKHKESGSSLDLQGSGKVHDGNSSGSPNDEVIVGEQAPSFYPSRREVFTAISEASDSAAPSPRREMSQTESGPPDATSIILPGPPTMPISPYPISHSSSFPSPRSPMSYDAHRISTAPSSIPDENNFHSLLMGEPGPEVVRLSIDVPSLTSTNSTMTRESTFIPGVRPRNMPFHDQRPASFTSTAFGRRRSSLASLSRLISSAHGERSKLSMEVPFENEAERKPKTSKSKRLTRMMQFWKPKTSSGS
ncbi:hypothetical protein F5Y19DRAFT_361659 [Xylariaceae sp. FL1651]|nr:hypothetical protein F5Y19DRAFT_361659 [Xylariaceae sp. FL1651]